MERGRVFVVVVDVDFIFFFSSFFLVVGVLGCLRLLLDNKPNVS